MKAARAPYDHPGFAPVSDELSGITLRIEGELPPGLEGLFLRNGTNAPVSGPASAHV